MHAMRGSSASSTIGSKSASKSANTRARAASPVKDAARESEVIAKVLDENEGPCPPEVLRRIYRILIDAAVRLEEE